MKKIIVFGMTENPGGIESFLMNYYRKLPTERIQFDFLCNTNEVAYEREIQKLGGKIYRIPARRDGRKRFRTALNSFMEKHANEYDAIWVNVCSLANIDYLKAAKKYGIVRRIIHCHNAANGDSFLRGILHLVNKKCIDRYATDFWSCSDSASEWFFGKNILKHPKYRLIYNAVDADEFVPDDNVRDACREELHLQGKLVIGHIGRFHFQKNHRFLLSVFQELQKINADYELLLVGQGELMEEIRSLAEQMNIERHVHFLGLRDDIAKLFQAMDVFVFPSVFEGLPLVLLEAQANGVPVVASDTITRSVKVNSNVYFESLKESPQQWAKRIDEQCRGQRRIVPTEFADSQYNVCSQVKELEQYLSES